MVMVFRWLLRLTGAAIILAMLAMIGIYYLASRSLPDYDKTIEVDSITAPVEIIRNNANVPHIVGKADMDAFFALGYVHAQDRLWQMTTMRRAVQGRLSEVFGPATIAEDKLARRFDLYGLARQSVDIQDGRTKDALQSYADGVNARLDEINRDSLGRGAPEMFLYNAPIAPWVPADSIALMKYLAWQYSGNIQSEVLRARTSLILSNEKRLQDILPDAPGAPVSALPRYSSLFDTSIPRYAASNDFHPMVLNPAGPFKGASNVWAAAPDRSASGGTLLANDPHMMLSAPSLWYLARMELSNGGVIGATVPGIPAILLGRRTDFGWGIAASSLDDADVYIEELNPDNPEEYRTPDGFKSFTSRKSIINIKDSAPVTLTLRWTDNGPVLAGSEYDVGTITPEGHVASVAWTALSPRDSTMSAAINLMYARTVKQGLSAGQDFISPSVNLVMADEVGIAMQTLGAMPLRRLGHQSLGRMPTPGWRIENRWNGRIPYTDNPSFVDPDGGLVGSTNNKFIDSDFPNHVTFDWQDTQRVQRWKRLMQARQVHTRDSFIEVQLDTVSVSALTILTLIGADLWFTGEAAADGTPERQRQRALDLLANWNGEMSEHMPEPLLYSAWVRALQKRLIQDDLGPLAREYTHVNPLFLERVFRDVEGASAWCDIIQSAPIETCSDIARMALDDALVDIGETYGPSLEALRWGDVHQATHDHSILGRVPLLRYFVNIRQSTSGGDNTLQRGLTRGSGIAPYENVHGANYRGVYDFADPDSSIFISSTGQSGHFLSRHYDDLGERWRRGEYIPMSLDLDLARAAATGVTVLAPISQ